MLDSDAELIHSQKVFVIARHVLHHKIVIREIRWHHGVDPFFLILYIHITLSAVLWQRRPAETRLAQYSEDSALNHPDVVVQNFENSELDQKQDNKSADSNTNKVDDVAFDSRLFPIEETKILGESKALSTVKKVG